MFERAGTKGEPFDILTAHWAADYADPSDFLNVLLDQRIKPRGNVKDARSHGWEELHDAYAEKLGIAGTGWPIA